MKVIFVAGARPNFMKVAPLLHALAARGGPLEAALVHTGQHYDAGMSDIFFEQLGIPAPDVHLEVGSGSHGEQTGRIMARFEEVLTALPEPPRGVVVVGDVNSTLACALVAVKAGVPLAHVEAGLRSFDRRMPEEINRLATDAIADLLLVSEPAGMANLAREGIDGDRIRYVGNVMIDTLVAQLPSARGLAMPARIGVTEGDYALVTLHRPSNVDDPDRLAALCGLLARLGARLPVIFAVHPRTAARLADLGLERGLIAAGVRLGPPLGYLELLGLVERARLVLTDSGGLQEETSFLGVPCVTLRTSTERPVTLSVGTNVLAPEPEAAWRAVERILTAAPPVARAIEGWDGRAAERVVDVLVERWVGPPGS
jgi:UDP-N-acetylglucosamine 2-epimerase (non-hydrolysing)